MRHTPDAAAPPPRREWDHGKEPRPRGPSTGGETMYAYELHQARSAELIRRAEARRTVR
ncbi:hypothetical protein GT016_17105, partial [Streptomyces sp. SID3915]|nr:hypothetical protein [Streptomyces sp. SID3915]